MPHTKVLTPYKWVTFKVCPFLILVILPCTHPLSTFHLCNVLHSPRACSNLFFVPKFSQDNHCYFSLDDKGFIVKDKTLRTMLFHNLIEHGLYPFCLALCRRFSRIRLPRCHFLVAVSLVIFGIIVSSIPHPTFNWSLFPVSLHQ